MPPGLPRFGAQVWFCFPLILSCLLIGPRLLISVNITPTSLPHRFGNQSLSRPLSELSLLLPRSSLASLKWQQSQVPSLPCGAIFGSVCSQATTPKSGKTKQPSNVISLTKLKIDENGQIKAIYLARQLRHDEAEAKVRLSTSYW